MDSIHKKILQISHVYLLEHIVADDICPYLFSKEILNDDDIERIKYEITQKDKCRFLLQLLLRKDHNAYAELIVSLHGAQQGYIVRHLNQNEKKVKARLFVAERFTDSSQDDPTLSTTTFSTLLTEHGIELEDDIIESIVAEMFKCSSSDKFYAKEITAEGGTAKTNKAEGGTVSSKSTTRESQNTSVPSKGTFENWTSGEVCHWLKDIPQSPLSNAAIDNFREQKVTGFTLCDITDEELKSDEFPDIKTFGERKFILKHISILRQLQTKSTEIVPNPVRNSNQEQEEHRNEDRKLRLPQEVDRQIVETTSGGKRNKHEHKIPIRKFNTGMPSPMEKYKKGGILDCRVLQKDNLINPINMFANLNLEDTGSAFRMARHIVEFSCACLNDRTNGRMYFGIENKPGKDFGKVKGTYLNKNEDYFQSMVQNVLRRCFCSDQIDIVLNCVRPLRFVEVIDCVQYSVQSERLQYVIELDVEPSYQLCKDEAFFVHLPKEIKKHCDDRFKLDKLALLRFCVHGMEDIDKEGIRAFMEIKARLAKTRKEKEQSYILEQRSVTSKRDELADDFKKLLCLGAEKLGDVYPILVSNQPSRSWNKDEDLQSKFLFVGLIPWIAIFDFDPDGRLYNFLTKNVDKNFKLITTADEFKEQARHAESKLEGMKTLQEDLKSSQNQPWIFTNGYNDMHDDRNIPLNQAEWKRIRRQGLREAIRFYEDLLPEHRCVIVFLLLSEDKSIYQEGVEEFLSCYPNQWMIVAENDHIAQPLIDELLHRESITETEIKRRTIIGMPWEHIAENVNEIICDTKLVGCKIPTSTGSKITIQQSLLETSFSDLEIVPANMCDEEAPLFSREELRSISITEENRFYKGVEVSWWNFYFQSHVLQRHIYPKLKHGVEKALKGETEEESSVARVYLYHQPGAGGTTTAKEILWKMKHIYRCVIVRNMPTEQTSNQIMKLWSYNDDNPKPLLLLLDNLDDNALDLLLELDVKAKRSINQTGYKSRSPFFVALICLRRTELPRTEPKMPSVLLNHELKPNEIRWFEDKAERINRRNDEISDSSYRVDLKLLISFNIMKSNFNKEFISKMTMGLVEGIKSPRERQLLKYVALLNAFDMSFTEVPSSAFDMMMVDFLWQKGSRRGRSAVNFITWETALSNEFRLLMNESPGQGLKHIRSFRITNVLLSKEIVFALKKIGGETTSQMALDFLGDNLLFQQRGLARDRLLKIIQKLMTMRERRPNGKPKSDYSPIIQEIVDDETIEKANDILVKALELTNDPFIAQHIARLNMFSQNWPKALEYAKKATEIRDHSYLWDTYARVYFRQVDEEYRKLLQAPAGTVLEMRTILNIMDLAKRAADIFQKVQERTEVEQQFSNTWIPGYFGELQINLALLNCLENSELFDGIEDLRLCLLEDKYYPAKLRQIMQEDGVNCDHISYLKQLKHRSEHAILKLDDERLQMKDEGIDEFRYNEARFRISSLDEVKVGIDFFFGEQLNEVPQHLLPVDACEFRRRRINQLSGVSSLGILDLRKVSTGFSTLMEIRQLCLENVNSGHARAIDYLKLLVANITLIQSNTEQAARLGIQFEDMVKLSCRLYELRRAMTRQVSLEPFMFYVIFNWPRTTTDKQYHKAPNVLRETMNQWKAAFLEKYPKQREDNRIFKKKEKTIFFFKNAVGLNTLAFYEDLDAPEDAPRPVSRDEFWKATHVKRTLQCFEGILKDGTMVQIKVNNGLYKNPIEIPTSQPIRSRDMWNKRVYFFIGFSWSGPKAFGVDMENLAKGPHDAFEDNPTSQVSNPQRYPEAERRNPSSGSELAQIRDDLQLISHLKQRRKQELTQKEIELLASENSLKWKRRKFLLKLQRKGADY